MWSIVPFKVLNRGKQRLAGVLTEPERAGLSRAMIEDLLNALLKVQSLEGMLVVSDDKGASLLAQKYGLELVIEDSSGDSGLNSAVKCAIDRLQTLSIDDFMVIHGDLPLVSPDDITNLIHHHRRSGKPMLTLVPDRWRSGTNCLLSSSCQAVPIRFGEDSMTKHLKAAEQQGIPSRVAEFPSIMFDIDTPLDLQELIRRLDTMNGSLAVNTRAFLDTIDRKRLLAYSTVAGGGNYAMPEHEVLQ